MKKIKYRALLFLLLPVALPGGSFAAQYIRDEVIPPGITRDAEIIPTGETNGICISNTGTTAPAIALCSTLALTGKTVLYKIPEYAFASIPAGNPLVIVTNSASASVCNGSGSTKAVCWYNGSAWVALSGGSFPDPGSNGIVVRSALNTLIARQIGVVAGQITVTNPTGVGGDPTLGVGSNVPLKDGNSTFSGTNNFTSALQVPRKATPGDLSLINNGEIFVDGELLRFKSNTGVVYTLFKFGDSVVRAFTRTQNPTNNADSTQGYLAGDIWLNTTAGTSCIAVSVATAAAVWHCPGTGGAGSKDLTTAVAEDGFVVRSPVGTDRAYIWWNPSRGLDFTCKPDDCLIGRQVFVSADNTRQAGNCAHADETIPSGGYPDGAVTCADTTGDEVSFGFTFPKGWNGGPIWVTPVVANVNASPSGTFTLAINGHCIPQGSARPSLSTSNSQNASFTTWGPQYAENQVETAPITLLGTCTAAPTEPVSVGFRARVTAIAQASDTKILKFLVRYNVLRNSL